MAKISVDIDVDAGGDSGFNGGQSLGRGWNLDHQIRSVHRLEEALGFVDGALGITRQQRRDLQADVTIATIAAVIDRAERGRLRLDILDSQ